MAWANVAADLLALAEDRPGLADWLQGLRARGQLRRIAASADDARTLVAQLRAVVAALPAGGTSIAGFSARILGHAHALDAGTPLGGLAAAAAEVLGRSAASGSGATGRAGDALPMLSGAPQATPWDARLAEVMRKRG